MKKFIKISHNGGHDAKIILADNRYEAVGFYLWEEVLNIAAESLDRVEILSSDFILERTSSGESDNRTLEQIWQEQNTWVSPKTIVSLPNEA